MWPHIQSQLRTPGPTGVTMALISFWPNYFSAQNLNVEESARPRWTQRSRGRRSRRTPSTTWTRRRRWVTRTATRVSDAGKWLWDESAVSQWPICPFLNKRLRTTRPSRMCKTTATATTPWSVLILMSAILRCMGPGLSHGWGYLNYSYKFILFSLGCNPRLCVEKFFTRYQICIESFFYKRNSFCKGPKLKSQQTLC